MGLLLMALSSAAAAPDMAETPRLRRFGAAEGMPSRMVLALAEDRQGHIWAATDGGLVRYDGDTLRVWEHDPEQPGSLPGNEIETLLVDPLDRVWVGINGKGVARLDADRERFRPSMPSMVRAWASSGRWPTPRMRFGSAPAARVSAGSGRMAACASSSTTPRA